MNTIYVYRPTNAHVDCAAVAYDEEGRELTWHISSGPGYFRLDMGLSSRNKHDIYESRYPDGYKLEEVIGNWREHPVMGKWERADRSPTESIMGADEGGESVGVGHE